MKYETKVFIAMYLTEGIEFFFKLALATLLFQCWPQAAACVTAIVLCLAGRIFVEIYMERF